MQTELYAQYFVRNIHSKIYQGIFRAIDELLNPGLGPGAMSIELFLASLYLSFGKQLLRKFDDPVAFMKMQKELIPTRGAQPKRGFFSRKRQGGVFVRYDPQLRDLLWDAIRISRALGRRSAGLPELIAALCLNEDIVNDLKERRGFTPVAFLEPLPS